MKTPQGPQQVKFTIIKSCLARFSDIFALGTPSNIHGTAISYRCAKFGAFVNSVTILTLRDLTKISFLYGKSFFATQFFTAYRVSTALPEDTNVSFSSPFFTRYFQCLLLFTFLFLVFRNRTACGTSLVQATQKFKYSLLLRKKFTCHRLSIVFYRKLWSKSSN